MYLFTARPNNCELYSQSILVFRHAKILAQTVVTDALYFLWLLTEKATLALSDIRLM